MNAPWNPNRRPGSSTRDPFVAFVCDEETAEAIRPVVGEMGWPTDRINKGGLRNAVQTLSVSASPSILFVDLSESGDPLNDINALAEVCEPGTIVIACGMVNDVRLYRDLLGSGLHDYVLKPLSTDQLRETFMGAQTVLMGPRTQETDKSKPRLLTAVIGVRGGAGASTLATSLAWLISQEGSRTTALLDLDVHFGTGALAFDLEPGRGLTDALENPSRIDGLFIERAMIKASETLSVLSAEATINQPLLMDGQALFQLQEEMRNAFDCVVMDLPRSVMVQHPHLITDAQTVIVVTELTLVGTRDTIRLLSWLKANAPAARVLIVANKVAAQGTEIGRKDFEGSIERKIDIALPLDTKVAVEAAKLGKCLAEVGKGSKLAPPLGQLVRSIVNGTDADAEEEPAGGKSLLGNLRSLLPAKAKVKAKAAAV